MRLVVLLIVCLKVVTGVPTDPQRIVGGAVTTIDQYPAIAALLYSYSGIAFSQSCGGSILNSRAILTAAHCPYGDPAMRWRVRIGSSYANNGGVLHSIASVTTHPEYNTRTTDNDVAILHTVETILYSTVVQPAYIAGVNYNVGDNDVVWAAGWGTTLSGGSTSEQLRHVQLWSVNHSVCKFRYSRVGATVTDNMLCSGWLNVGGRDQCQGDSGGPLYHPYNNVNVVIGICSWGYGCANPEYPGVNTRVSRYTKWIQANV